MIEAAILDMDGVVTNSESFICEAAIRMLREHGVEATPHDFKPFVGAGDNKYVGGVARKYGITDDVQKLKERTYDIYDELIRGRLMPLPGVHEFIARCRKRKLKVALATSTDHRKMVSSLTESGVPLETFDAIVEGQEVEKKKPDPEIFLVAAKRLGVAIEHSLIVEDAVNGVQAAKASGARCLALLTSFPREQLRGADWFSNTLADAPEEALNW